MSTLICTTGFILLLAGFQAVNSAHGQTPTSQQQKASPSESQPQPAAVSPSPSQTAIQQPEASIEAQKRPDKPSGFWDMKLTDVIQVGINVVLLFVVFWQARINRDQRQTMQRQSEIMQGELDITRDSIKQGERALAANEAMARAADESAKIAKETFYLGERPYFGIVKMGLSFNENAPMLSLTLMNGGETPAWKVKVIAYLVFGKTPEDGSNWLLRQFNLHISKRFIPGGQERDFLFVTKQKTTPEERDRVFEKGDLKCFAVVVAVYTDMRGEHYTDKFITVFRPGVGSMDDWEDLEVSLPNLSN